MEIEYLWEEGLSDFVTGDFEEVRCLYLNHESFAEMCRDFVEINTLHGQVHASNPHVSECLNGLKDEILTYFANSKVRGTRETKVNRL